MTNTVPEHTSQWQAVGKLGLDGLTFHEDVPIPQLGPSDCLVRIDNISLNYRDVAILEDLYPSGTKDHIVPCSDASATVIQIGSAVHLHKVGDQVCTLFNQDHLSGYPTPAIRQTSLGSRRDGVLREFAVFHENGLVPAPKSLTSREVSTLSCAALTAWNALTGIADRKVRPGDYVLVQGTGGVSLFAMQFAQALGAAVIATTSSEEKGRELRERFGIEHVINYKVDSEWGKTAKSVTKDGLGVHHIVEVGGNTTMAQSLEAIRCEGIISIIGFLGNTSKSANGPSFADCLRTLAVVRGVNVGSKEQFIEMNEFIDKHSIKPVIDDQSFAYRDAKDALQYMRGGKHFGKVVIPISMGK